jgi:hypothetical protein
VKVRIERWLLISIQIWTILYDIDPMSCT